MIWLFWAAVSFVSARTAAFMSATFIGELTYRPSGMTAAIVGAAVGVAAALVVSDGVVEIALVDTTVGDGATAKEGAALRGEVDPGVAVALGVATLVEEHASKATAIVAIAAALLIVRTGISSPF